MKLANGDVAFADPLWGARHVIAQRIAFASDPMYPFEVLPATISAVGEPARAAESEVAGGARARELADVLNACLAVGPTLVVGPAGTPVGEAKLVSDPRGGQGAAVQAGLDAAVASDGGRAVRRIAAGVAVLACGTGTRRR